MKKSKKMDIMKMLSENDYLTGNTIAKKLSISSRTVQKIIKEINAQEDEFGAKIVSRKSRGYQLQIIDKDQFSLLFSNKITNSLPTYPKERFGYILWYLIQNDHVKLIDLSEKIYVSQATLTNDMKEVEEHLRKYNLSIERKPYHGMRIVGREFDKRMCLADSVREGYLYDGYPYLESQRRKNILSKITKKHLEIHSFRMSAIAFNELINHIYIALIRIENHLFLDDNMENIEKDSLIYQISKNILSNIQNHLQLDIPTCEVKYLMLILQAKQTIIQSGNLSFDSCTLEIADDMIESVYEAFNIDLRDDLELKISLCQHLIPLQTRVKCGISTVNPILDEIRKEFPLCNAMASYASKEILSRYSQTLSEDEVGFIALAFALAMEKKKAQPEKLYICLISAYGKMNSKLFEYQIRNNFGEYIEDVYSIDVQDIKNFNFSNVDYVFSTIPINEEIPVPIIMMSSLNCEEQFNFIKRIFRQKNLNCISDYFDLSLFKHETESDKKEILENLCKMIEDKQGKVGLLPAVLRREEMGNTVFCKNVAMPHPDKVICNSTNIAVSVLNEPVLWEQQKYVQIIFLVCISKYKKDNLTTMYNQLSKIIMNEKYIDKLIKNPQYSTLLKIIEEINNVR